MSTGKTDNKKIRKTSGYKKVVRYVEEVLDTDKYHSWIKDTRKKYGIPKDGYEANNGEMRFPPDGWDIDGDKWINLNEEIMTFCREYATLPDDFKSIVEEHLLYNEEFDAELIDEEQRFDNLCFVSTIEADKKAEESRRKSVRELKRDCDKAYPVLLRISPYAKSRDILDYVKSMYSQEIKPMQKLYKKDHVRLGSISEKKPKIKERNDFIYKNRDLPRKEILQLVREKFKEVLDYGHIGKIISLEKAKRTRKKL